MRLLRRPTSRLHAVRTEQTRLRDELAVLDEHLRHVQEVADEARTRAVVSPTSLDARELRTADSDLRRVRRERDEVLARLAALDARTDRLLDEILQEGR